LPVGTNDFTFSDVIPSQTTIVENSSEFSRVTASAVTVILEEDRLPKDLVLALVIPLADNEMFHFAQHENLTFRPTDHYAY
jgi:hypothetical protein